MEKRLIDANQRLQVVLEDSHKQQKKFNNGVGPVGVDVSTTLGEIRDGGDSFFH